MTSGIRVDGLRKGSYQICVSGELSQEVVMC